MDRRALVFMNHEVIRDRFVFRYYSIEFDCFGNHYMNLSAKFLNCFCPGGQAKFFIAGNPYA